MARQFLASNSRYLGGTVAAVSLPVTLSAWFYSTSSTSEMIAAYANSGSDSPVIGISVNGSAGNFDCLYRGDSGGIVVAPAAAYTLNVWQHGAAVFPSTSSRTPYLNGVAGATDTTALISATINDMGIGVWNRLNLASFFDGRTVKRACRCYAQAGLWNVIS